LISISKKIIIFILILSFPIGLMTYAIYIPSYRIAVDKMLMEIKKESTVLDAEILFSESKLIRWTVNIRISFNNGGNLIVSRINEWGRDTKKKPMSIYFINNYNIRFYNVCEEQFVLFEGLDIWSTLIGVNLETISDIVKNYSLISKFVDKLPDITSYIDNENYNNMFIERNKKLLDTLHRVLRENLFSESIIFINERNIFIYKYKYDL